ncbi:putative signal-transduction protein containing cAMP-binding and CBS domains [Candidatus Nitrososphaera evergladensis SR1]|uniref:Putative signal-transduction protein containing cAMP-binding and CBS domains n=1 Tax=Candidatus Nitrososphaera evergladensis SR1 TaxID=1459636 RepID=A0A075MP85_9ARCH|nr:CBS domain-containing protein [Candidatus Nitrososphaera evergladensis]AIF82970.1 putative signal-transduction protein containing cAMP-binding and CBS domains [Candidatus Nitrososphaera evergladensis SR1]
MSIETIPISSIMTKEVRTAGEGQTLRTVVEIMDKNDIGSVVIVDNKGSPSGIITERDIVRLVGSPKTSFAAAAKSVMKKPVVTADTMMSLKDALQTMQSKNIRRLPVVEKGKMVGIVTDKDIFRAILKSQELVSSTIGDSVLIEYRPIYERLSEFMLSEIYQPQGGR